MGEVGQRIIARFAYIRHSNFVCTYNTYPARPYLGTVGKMASQLRRLTNPPHPFIFPSKNSTEFLFSLSSTSFPNKFARTHSRCL